MAYCPNCGKETSQAAKYCRECGFDLKAEEDGGGESAPIASAERVHSNTRFSQSGDPTLKAGYLTQEKLKAQNKPRKKNWFHKHPSVTMFIAWISGTPIAILTGIILLWSGIALLLCAVYVLLATIVCGIALRWKGRSLWWLLLLFVPLVWLVPIGLNSIPKGSWGILDWLVLITYPLGWLVLIGLESIPKGSWGILTQQQVDAGLSLQGDGDFLNLLREGEFITAFHAKGTIKTIKSEVEKYLVTHMPEQPRSSDAYEHPVTSMPEQPRSSDTYEHPFKPIPEQPRSVDTGKCPWCGNYTVGKAKGLKGGNEPLVFFLLFLLCFIPGIVYYIHMGNVPYCSSCGQRVRK